MKGKLITLAGIGLLLGLAKPVPAQTTFVNPMPNGGYMITTPGTNQRPTFINPIPNGGYMITQPGAPPTFSHPYAPPTFASPYAPTVGNPLGNPDLAPHNEPPFPSED